MNLYNTGFLTPGRMSFILGGQWGSEGKGAAAAWAAVQLMLGANPNAKSRFDIVTCNSGVQSGHTSIHGGVKRIAYHLPTASMVVRGSIVYLNAGSIIDPLMLEQELRDPMNAPMHNQFFIHPNAAVVTDECREAEMKPDSAQTKIASTRKGVGEALSRKVLRSGMIAKDHPFLKQFVRRIDLNERLMGGDAILAEVPQGIGLSLNGKFYPHCTSRDCTVGQAMSDAHVHPSFMGKTLLVLRTFPIRVGNIYDAKSYDAQGFSIREYSSGGCYPDQRETTWEALGVEAEITTVTKRIRRVFTWSQQQVIDAFVSARPSIVYLSFGDYVKDAKPYVRSIYDAARAVKMHMPMIVVSNGPTTDDVKLLEG